MAVGRVYSAESPVEFHKKRRIYYNVFLIFDIFHQKHFALMPVLFEKKIKLALDWLVFGEEKIKINAKKKTSIKIIVYF